MFRIVTVSFVDGTTKAVLMNVSPDRSNVISVPVESKIRFTTPEKRVINLTVKGVCKIARAEARFVECNCQLPSNDLLGTLEKSGCAFVFKSSARKMTRDGDVDQDGQSGQIPRSSTA